MDIMYLVGAALGGVVGGAIIQLFVQAPLAYRIKRLENSLASEKGVFAREQAKADEMAELIEAGTEAMQLHSEGKGNLEIIKTVVMHHPSVAISMVEKLLSGKLDLKKLMNFKGGIPAPNVSTVNQADVEQWQRRQ